MAPLPHSDNTEQGRGMSQKYPQNRIAYRFLIPRSLQPEAVS